MGRKIPIEEMTGERYPGTTRGLWAMRRYQSLPPIYIKIGKKVFYDEEDLDEFDRASKRTGTGEAVAS